MIAALSLLTLLSIVPRPPYARPPRLFHAAFKRHRRVSTPRDLRRKIKALRPSRASRLVAFRTSGVISHLIGRRDQNLNLLNTILVHGTTPNPPDP